MGLFDALKKDSNKQPEPAREYSREMENSSVSDPKSSEEKGKSINDFIKKVIIKGEHD